MLTAWYPSALAAFHLSRTVQEVPGTNSQDWLVARSLVLYGLSFQAELFARDGALMPDAIIRPLSERDAQRPLAAELRIIDARLIL
jgi:hypothetical protein